ncbi:9775_t:CDS:2, partial [Racocetra persica]
RVLKDAIPKRNWNKDDLPNYLLEQIWHKQNKQRLWNAYIECLQNKYEDIIELIEEYDTGTSRLLKENANLFCKYNPKRIIQRREEHVNWATYNEQHDKHHCCRKEYNRPTAKEDLYYIKGLFINPYTFQVIYIEETLYCKGCYSEMHEALDFKNPKIKIQDLFNNELQSESDGYEELMDDDKDPELCEARLLSINQDKRKQVNISLCKECLMPKEQNEKGYCKGFQREIDTTAVNLITEEEFNEPHPEKPKKETSKEIHDEKSHGQDLLYRNNISQKIKELYTIFGLMAEQQFRLTQENKALVKKITILEQLTLELQNKNQKLKRKLKDTQDYINLEDPSEDEDDEMKYARQFRSHKAKYNNRF